LDNFEKNAVNLARTEGYDVAICGHIHHPKITDDYMNSGDFCENSTCLVEDFNGEWKILEI
jgi:UDP-2,3-diacylglucosamine pyrophosphatase LpxH